MGKTGDYCIPFDRDGDQLHWVDEWEVKHNGAKMVPNFEFNETLTFDGFCRGRSAAYARFLKSDGREVTMFLVELEEAIKHMTNGVVSGRFTFCKRGMNYGCKRIGDAQ